MPLRLGSLCDASTRLIAALGSAHTRLPRRLAPRRTLIQPDGLTVYLLLQPWSTALIQTRKSRNGENSKGLEPHR